jgi:hypothetical protein
VSWNSSMEQPVDGNAVCSASPTEGRRQRPVATSIQSDGRLLTVVLTRTRRHFWFGGTRLDVLPSIPPTAAFRSSTFFRPSPRLFLGLVAEFKQVRTVNTFHWEKAYWLKGSERGRTGAAYLSSVNVHSKQDYGCETWSIYESARYQLA